MGRNALIEGHQNLCFKSISPGENFYFTLISPGEILLKNGVGETQNKAFFTENLIPC